jgi:hypothetical protein
LFATFTRPIPVQAWLTKAALFLSGNDKPYVRAGSRPAQMKSGDRRDS